MRFSKRNFFTTLFSFLLIFPFIAFGQDGNEVEMADAFRNDGKIYIVIAVISIVLVGLVTYLILIDRKVNKMEKRMKGEK